MENFRAWRYANSKEIAQSARQEGEEENAGREPRENVAQAERDSRAVRFTKAEEITKPDSEVEID